MSTASKKEMEELHATLARTLKGAIESPGEEGVKASILSVARQFLKDNGIEAVPTEGSPLASLAGALEDDFEVPFPGETPQPH